MPQRKNPANIENRKPYPLWDNALHKFDFSAGGTEENPPSFNMNPVIGPVDMRPVGFGRWPVEKKREWIWSQPEAQDFAARAARDTGIDITKIPQEFERVFGKSYYTKVGGKIVSLFNESRQPGGLSIQNVTFANFQQSTLERYGEPYMAPSQKAGLPAERVTSMFNFRHDTEILRDVQRLAKPYTGEDSIKQFEKENGISPILVGSMLLHPSEAGRFPGVAVSGSQVELAVSKPSKRFKTDIKSETMQFTNYPAQEAGMAPQIGVAPTVSRVPAMVLIGQGYGPEGQGTYDPSITGVPWRLRTVSATIPQDAPEDWRPEVPTEPITTERGAFNLGDDIRFRLSQTERVTFMPQGTGIIKDYVDVGGGKEVLRRTLLSQVRAEYDPATVAIKGFGFKSGMGVEYGMSENRELTFAGEAVQTALLTESNDPGALAYTLSSALPLEVRQEIYGKRGANRWGPGYTEKFWDYAAKSGMLDVATFRQQMYLGPEGSTENEAQVQALINRKVAVIESEDIVRGSRIGNVRITAPAVRGFVEVTPSIAWRGHSTEMSGAELRMLEQTGADPERVAAIREYSQRYHESTAKIAGAYEAQEGRAPNYLAVRGQDVLDNWTNIITRAEALSKERDLPFDIEEGVSQFGQQAHILRAVSEYTGGAGIVLGMRRMGIDQDDLVIADPETLLERYGSETEVRGQTFGLINKVVSVLQNAATLQQNPGDLRAMAALASSAMGYREDFAALVSGPAIRRSMDSNRSPGIQGNIQSDAALPPAEMWMPPKRLASILRQVWNDPNYGDRALFEGETPDTLAEKMIAGEVPMLAHGSVGRDPVNVSEDLNIPVKYLTAAEYNALHGNKFTPEQLAQMPAAISTTLMAVLKGDADVDPYKVRQLLAHAYADVPEMNANLLGRVSNAIGGSQRDILEDIGEIPRTPDEALEFLKGSVHTLSLQELAQQTIAFETGKSAMGSIFNAWRSTVPRHLETGAAGDSPSMRRTKSKLAQQVRDEIGAPLYAAAQDVKDVPASAKRVLSMLAWNQNTGGYYDYAKGTAGKQIDPLGVSVSAFTELGRDLPGVSPETLAAQFLRPDDVGFDRLMAMFGKRSPALAGDIVAELQNQARARGATTTTEIQRSIIEHSPFMEAVYSGGLYRAVTKIPRGNKQPRSLESLDAWERERYEAGKSIAAINALRSRSHPQETDLGQFTTLIAAMKGQGLLSPEEAKSYDEMLGLMGEQGIEGPSPYRAAREWERRPLTDLDALEFLESTVKSVEGEEINERELLEPSLRSKLVDTFPGELADVIANRQRLQEVPGIDRAIANRITDVYNARYGGGIITSKSGEKITRSPLLEALPVGEIVKENVTFAGAEQAVAGLLGQVAPKLTRQRKSEIRREEIAKQATAKAQAESMGPETPPWETELSATPPAGIVPPSKPPTITPPPLPEEPPSGDPFAPIRKILYGSEKVEDEGERFSALVFASHKQKQGLGGTDFIRAGHSQAIREGGPELGRLYMDYAQKQGLGFHLAKEGTGEEIFELADYVRAHTVSINKSPGVAIPATSVEPEDKTTLASAGSQEVILPPSMPKELTTSEQILSWLGQQERVTLGPIGEDFSGKPVRGRYTKGGSIQIDPSAIASSFKARGGAAVPGPEGVIFAPRNVSSYAQALRKSYAHEREGHGMQDIEGLEIRKSDLALELDAEYRAQRAEGGEAAAEDWLRRTIELNPGLTLPDLPSRTHLAAPGVTPPEEQPIDETYGIETSKQPLVAARPLTDKPEGLYYELGGITAEGERGPATHWLSAVTKGGELVLGGRPGAQPTVMTGATVETSKTPGTGPAMVRDKAALLNEMDILRSNYTYFKKAGVVRGGVFGERVAPPEVAHMRRLATSTGVTEGETMNQERLDRYGQLMPKIISGWYPTTPEEIEETKGLSDFLSQLKKVSGAVTAADRAQDLFAEQRDNLVSMAAELGIPPEKIERFVEQWDKAAQIEQPTLGPARAMKETAFAAIGQPEEWELRGYKELTLDALKRAGITKRGSDALQKQAHTTDVADLLRGIESGTIVGEETIRTKAKAIEATSTEIGAALALSRGDLTESDIGVYFGAIGAMPPERFTKTGATVAEETRRRTADADLYRRAQAHGFTDKTQIEQEALRTGASMNAVEIARDLQFGLTSAQQRRQVAEATGQPIKGDDLESQLAEVTKRLIDGRAAVADSMKDMPKAERELAKATIDSTARTQASAILRAAVEERGPSGLADLMSGKEYRQFADVLTPNVSTGQALFGFARSMTSPFSEERAMMTRAWKYSGAEEVFNEFIPAAAQRDMAISNVAMQAGPYSPWTGGISYDMAVRQARIADARAQAGEIAYQAYGFGLEVPPELRPLEAIVSPALGAGAVAGIGAHFLGAKLASVAGATGAFGTALTGAAIPIGVAVGLGVANYGAQQYGNAQFEDTANAQLGWLQREESLKQNIRDYNLPGVIGDLLGAGIPAIFGKEPGSGPFGILDMTGKKKTAGEMADIGRELLQTPFGQLDTEQRAGVIAYVTQQLREKEAFAPYSPEQISSAIGELARYSADTNFTGEQLMGRSYGTTLQRTLNTGVTPSSFEQLASVFSATVPGTEEEIARYIQGRGFNQEQQEAFIQDMSKWGFAAAVGTTWQQAAQLTTQYGGIAPQGMTSMSRVLSGDQIFTTQLMEGRYQSGLPAGVQAAVMPAISPLEPWTYQQWGTTRDWFRNVMNVRPENLRYLNRMGGNFGTLLTNAYNQNMAQMSGMTNLGAGATSMFANGPASMQSFAQGWEPMVSTQMIGEEFTIDALKAQFSPTSFIQDWSGESIPELQDLYTLRMRSAQGAQRAVGWANLAFQYGSKGPWSSVEDLGGVYARQRAINLAQRDLGYAKQEGGTYVNLEGESIDFTGAFAFQRMGIEQSFGSALAGAQTNLALQQRQREFQLQQRGWTAADMATNVERGRIGFAQQWEDIGRAESRADTQYTWQQQDMAIQRTQFALGREQTLLQRGWAAADLDTQRATSQLQFGWQMEDLDENIRFASGRQRKQLLRQRERAVTMENIDEERMDTQESRVSKLNELEDERYSLQEESLDNQMERLEEQRAWQDEDFDIQKERMQQSRTWQEEDWAKEEKRFAQRNKYEDDIYKLQQKASDQQMASLVANHALQIAQLDESIKAYNESKKIQDVVLKLQDEIDVHTANSSRAMLAASGAMEAVANDMETFTRMASTAGQMNDNGAVDRLNEFMQEVVNAQKINAFRDAREFIGGVGDLARLLRSLGF